MPYDALCNYLVDKYGAAKYDYFDSPSCENKSTKISRAREGLFCHHMDEDKGVKLSDSHNAQLQPYKWQLKERLVYCNILEHLIFHIKIAVLRQKHHLKKPDDIINFFTSGGIFIICQDINDMFLYADTHAAKYKNGYKVIKENYGDYLILLNAILKYIEAEYVSDKTAPEFLQPGSIIHFRDCDCEITAVAEGLDAVLIKMPSGEECEMRLFSTTNQLTYTDYVNIVVRKFSCGEYGFIKNIYNDIANCKKVNEIENARSYSKSITLVTDMFNMHQLSYQMILAHKMPTSIFQKLFLCTAISL